MLKREHKVALFVVFAVEAVEFTLWASSSESVTVEALLLTLHLPPLITELTNAMFSPAEAVSLNVISTPEQLSEDTVTRLSLYKP